MKRNFQIAALPLTLSLCFPAVIAAGFRDAIPLGTIPADNTSLAQVAAQGTGVPLSALEPQEEITLLNLLNRTRHPFPVRVTWRSAPGLSG